MIYFSCLKPAHSRGLIGQLAEPMCKVNPFPQQSNICLTGNAVEDFGCNVSKYIIQYYWPKFVKKQQK